jgi:hypothetical protein
MVSHRILPRIVAYYLLASVVLAVALAEMAYYPL